MLYPSSDDEHSSEELERWVQNIPHPKITSNHKSLSKPNSGAVQTPRVSDSSTFDPLRTLQFLVKELRGKIHDDCELQTLISLVWCMNLFYKII